MDVKACCKRYCIALLTTIAAIWFRQLIAPWVGERVPFGTYLLAVFLTAWLAGTGPATLALLLGILAAAHFHVAPENSVMVGTPGDLLALFVYAVVGAVAISLFDRTSRQHGMTRRQIAQIKILSEELKTADRRKDEFLAILAHELRNPLAPIRSGLLLLQQSGIEDQRRLTVFRTIGRQLDQLIRIVDDLLDVARIVHGKIELDSARVDLSELVETAIEQSQDAIEGRRHSLQVLLPERPAIVHGDRVRVIQIITNLITNAAKYTPHEGRIQILLDVDDREASLKVIDNGIGISQDAQDHVFELFARSEAAIHRDQAGLGLGLPLARQLAELHGGRLVLTSDGPARGSCFTFTMPVAHDVEFPHGDSRDFQVPEPAENLHETDDAPQAERVLIIDDNCDAAETLAALLTFDGFEVRTAQDGTEGIRLAEGFRPDAVLLDIGLPGMDGYEVARRLRAASDSRDRRIIAVTGWSGAADVKRSQAAGIDHHLVKPVDPDELTRLIRGEAVAGDMLAEPVG